MLVSVVSLHWSTLQKKIETKWWPWSSASVFANSVENREKSCNRYWKFQANFWNLADLVVWEFAKVSGSNTLRCHYHERGTTRIWQDCFEGIAYKNWIWFFCCNFGCLKCVLYIYFYWSRHWKNIESFFTVCFLLILTPKLKSGPSLSPDIFSAQVPLTKSC